MVREWQDKDLEDLFEIYKDPEIFRFIPGGKASENLEQAKERLQRFKASKDSGFSGSGIFALVDKNLSRPIGTVLLKRLTLNGGKMAEETEVGWHLKKEYRGQGLATEAARLLLEYGFRDLKLQEILAVVGPENSSSRRVAERLGMLEEGLCHRYYDVPVILFRMSAGEYRNLRQQ